MTRLSLMFLVVLPALFTLGCGSGRPAHDVERGRKALAAALDSWKANEPPTKLKSLPEPVNFPEELRATHTLTDYTLGAVVETSDAEHIHYRVTLRLKDRKGKESEREVVYAVALKNPVAVSRDPYY
jgi:hypothetical protein